MRTVLGTLLLVLLLAGAGSAATVTYNCIRFTKLSSILFIIFMGMVYTQMAVIFGRVRL